MSKPDSKKICALIRQTWYEAAKRNLNAEERLRFYEICFEYEFENLEPAADLPLASRIMFDMVRHDIDEDRSRAMERAERNRKNGMAGGRPKVTADNKTDNNQVGFVGFSGLPNTVQYNTEQNNTKQSETEDAHTLFSVCLMFFEKGCSEPVKEGQLFWNYYASQGWQNKSGAAIVDRMALARAWRLKDCSAAVMKSRAPYADLMHKAAPVELSLLEDFVKMVRDGANKEVVITLQHQETAVLLDTKYMPALEQWIPRDEDGKLFNLRYQCMKSSME